MFLVGECGTSGGEDEDHCEERIDSEVCWELPHFNSEQNLVSILCISLQHQVLPCALLF